MIPSLVLALLALNTSDTGPIAAPLRPPAPAEVAPGESEDAWSALTRDRNLSLAADPDATGAAENLRMADAARTFYSRFPADAHAREARKLEALHLVDAARFGSLAVRERARAAVQAFRRASDVPGFDRAVVAGTFEFDAAAQAIGSLEELEQAYERVARGLMIEFPDQPQGYISLLTQAERRPQAQAQAMATEVAAAPLAPADVRVEARLLLARLALVGQDLPRLVGDALPWTPGEAGLLYFWSTQSSGSRQLREELSDRVDGRVRFIAVCIDEPTGAAGTDTGGQPGTEHGEPPDDRSPPGDTSGFELARRLQADRAPLLYLVDDHGRVADVRGLQDLEVKLQRLGL